MTHLLATFVCLAAGSFAAVALYRTVRDNSARIVEALRGQ